MTGEVIQQDGASAWIVVGSGISLTAGVQVQAHAAATIASLMAATEKDYPEFDARLQITAGTPTENNNVQIHLRPKADGTNAEPAPSGSFEPHYMGSFTLDNTVSSYYYVFRLQNWDKNGSIYLKSNEATTTLAISLAGEGLNGTAEIVADESFAPVGESFTSPTSEGTGLSIGTMTPTDTFPIWIRRVVASSQASLSNDTGVLSFKGDTAG
jgi:hypothetical protein